MSKLIFLLVFNPISIAVTLLQTEPAKAAASGDECQINQLVRGYSEDCLRCEIKVAYSTSHLNELLKIPYPFIQSDNCQNNSILFYEISFDHQYINIFKEGHSLRFSGLSPPSSFYI